MGSPVVGRVYSYMYIRAAADVGFWQGDTANHIVSHPLSLSLSLSLSVLALLTPFCKDVVCSPRPYISLAY